MRVLALIFMASLLGFSASAREAHTYRSATLGFQITKPATWSYLSEDEFRDVLQTTKFGDGTFQTLLEANSVMPQVFMTKYKEPTKDLNPTITAGAYAYRREEKNNPALLIAGIIKHMKIVMPNFALAEAPRETLFAGLKATNMTIHSTMDTKGGTSIPATTQLWIIPRPHFFLMFQGSTRRDEANGSWAEIDAILKTVMIDPPIPALRAGTQ